MFNHPAGLVPLPLVTFLRTEQDGVFIGGSCWFVLSRWHVLSVGPRDAEN